MRAYEFLLESAPRTVYHGSNSDFNKFDQSKSRIINDNYGGGVAYFTDSPNVAKKYAKTMANKYGNEPILYSVNLSVNNIFDVNDEFSGNRLMEFINQASSVDSFLRGAKLLLLGTDKSKLLRDLESGNLSLTGDQIFKGLSNGMVNTSQARKILQRLGYDALRYNAGGILGQDSYSVYLVYNAADIDIVGKDKV